MTLQDCITRIKQDKINAYTDEQITRWINTVNKNAHLFLDLPSDYVELEYPASKDTILIIDTPYDEAYDYYVYSKIDFYNNEIASYNNSNVLYNAAYTEFKKAMIRDGKIANNFKFKNYEP